MEVRAKVRNEIISFKGVAEGVKLIVKNSDLELVKKALEEKVKKPLEFYQGIKILGIEGNDLSQEDIFELGLILKYRYDLDISLDQLPIDFEDMFCKKSEVEEEVLPDELHEGPSRFVYGTLRSGQVIDYQGHIVVIGDVNPGALLKAEGNIIVLGSLRGVAHAGLGGNTGAIVAAYNLLPTQLRIADTIVRAPDGDVSEGKLPELARFHNGEVVIEPYLPNK